MTTGRFRISRDTWLDDMLDRERDQLPLWLPVALGTGIAAWFVIPLQEAWIAFMLAALAIAAFLQAAWSTSRAARVVAIFCVLAAIGCGLVWWKALSVDAAPLERPLVSSFSGRIESVELLSARQSVRLLLSPDAAQGLPSRLRLTVDTRHVVDRLAPGMRVYVRARLMPPPSAGLPGAYDFARVAWFRGIGATGRALEPVRIIEAPPRAGLWEGIAQVRARLTAHVHRSLGGSEGGVAAAFVTGDQGAIAEGDAEAMRISGLAHLLSISGLHVSVVVGGTMLLVMRVLSLSSRLALGWPLPIIAAAVAAVMGIAYTMIAGAEVPTLRSCIAAILILVALVMGREALTLRLVATGALVVLLIWPEALVGPSFQLSFAAVTTLVAFHEHPRMAQWFGRREEGGMARIMRGGAALLLAGLAIEVALAPIALFHFHRTGLYGALANTVAIPLTSFVIMPLEGAALLFDLIGLGAPFWWLAGASLRLLLALAHMVCELPGATAALPSMPRAAFALMVAGGLGYCLWRSAIRRLGIAVFVAGALWAVLEPPPDLLLTGDGRHLAIRDAEGRIALLRPRAGDYVRDMLGEAAAGRADGAIELLPAARCNADLCMVDVVTRDGKQLRVMATRSPYWIEWTAMVAACRTADIVISDRRLPRGCTPRWLKIDRDFLQGSGGIALSLSPYHLRTTRAVVDDHPWMMNDIDRAVRGAIRRFRRSLA